MATTTTGRLGETPTDAIKQPCVAATTANIALSGTKTIDSVAVVAGDRVLVRLQTDNTENGLYRCTTGAWTRTTDWNAADDVIDGQLVWDANNERFYSASFTGDYEPGTTSLLFTVYAEGANSAEEWANNAEDVLVSAEAGGDQVDDYSALHHSAKASAQRVLAEAAETNAAADAVSTAADVVTTTQDAIDTAADAVTTAQDAIDTAADLVATNQDTIDTAADVVSAEAAKDYIDLAHLGGWATAPTTLNDLVTPLGAAHNGIRYWNTTTTNDWTWNGSSWGLTSTSVATNANNVSISDSGSKFVGTDVELALQEVAKSNLTAGQDIDAIFIAGIYQLTSPSNNPVIQTQMTLIVSNDNIDDDFTYQVAIGTTEIYFRRYSSSAWSSWVELPSLLAAQTFTNKTLTSPVINGSLTGTAIGRGALVYSNAVQTITTNGNVDFQLEDYDTDSIHDTAGAEDHKLTVPANITKVRISYGLQFSTTVASGNLVASVYKNGSVVTGGGMLEVNFTDTSNNFLNYITPIINVSAGDILTVYVQETSTGTVSMISTNNRTWSSMEIIK